MDRKKQRINLKELIACIAVFSAASMAAAWLFYDSFVAVPLFFPLFPFFINEVKKTKTKKHKQELTDEFLKAIMSVSASVSAGLSSENAFVSALHDMEKLYGKKAPIVKELGIINSKVKTGHRLSDELRDFAARSAIPEIYDFSVVFSVAKDNGSDLSAVISTCVDMMETKRRTENEAQLAIRAKQYEQRVMCVIPPAILAYLRISSGNFINVLYHDLPGIIIMTVCLFIYVLAIRISERIGDIEV